jgi:hypothetical protein
MKINKIGSLKYSAKSGDFTKQVKIRKTFFLTSIFLYLFEDCGSFSWSDVGGNVSTELKY